VSTSLVPLRRSGNLPRVSFRHCQAPYPNSTLIPIHPARASHFNWCCVGGEHPMNNLRDRWEKRTRLTYLKPYKEVLAETTRLCI
jgi:hypothetical protein